MSVGVKTPTRTQFEHKEFPCGNKTSPTVTVTVSATEGNGGISAHAGNVGGPSVNVLRSSITAVSPRSSHETNGRSAQSRNVVKHDRNGNQQGRPGFYRFESAPGGRALRKRRHSERTPGEYTGNRQSFQYKRGRFGKFRGTERIVLPTKFLLGGNITDPLNLNSLCDDEVNKALNEKTPQSSPLPIPAHRKQVEVLIPPNITDPLNLNSGEEVDLNLLSPKTSNKKKRGPRHKKKRSLDAWKSEESTTGEHSDFSKPVHIDVGSETTSACASSAAQNNDDTAESQQPFSSKIRKVIDKIVSPVIPQTSPKSWRKKRTTSEGKGEGISRASLVSEESIEKVSKADKTSPIRPKYRRQGSSQQSQPQQAKPNKQKPNQPKFIYGNYNRYYGYRNPSHDQDERLCSMQAEWFDGKDVLDIGCNVGHVTLAIARDFSPRKVIGTDIDSHLIKAAKQNIRHYLSSKKTDTSRFPVSMVKMFGPIAAPPVVENRDSRDENDFPGNVHFVQGNYVLERDELLDLQREEYDVIMALSLTKWIHLNFGDEGLKRAFKRMFRQLRPGGRLILEPQSWSSYKKKKKLSDRIFKNYQSIGMRPEQFTEYLLSREVGFSTCLALKMPFNKAKGFQRPLQVFTKADTTYVTPIPEPWSSSTTPVMRPFEDSRGNTPKFIVGSGPGTPSTGWSAVSSNSQSPAPSPCLSYLTPTPTPTPNPTPDCVMPSQEMLSESTSPRPFYELKCNSAPSLLESCRFITMAHSKVNEDKSDEMEDETTETSAEPDSLLVKSSPPGPQMGSPSLATTDDCPVNSKIQQTSDPETGDLEQETDSQIVAGSESACSDTANQRQLSS